MSDINQGRDAHDAHFAHPPRRSAKPGDRVTFGVYAQTGDGSDETPITWRVLENSGGELFLLSEFILDCKRYHSEWVDVTWRDCDLRKWLNGEFYNVAFSDAEKELVKTTLGTDNGEGRPDAQDKVFLLSVAEVKRLDSSIGKEHLRRAVGTEFAKANKPDGCRLYVYDKSVEDDYLLQNGHKQGCSWWWLRTQLGDASRATFMGTRASIRSYGRVNLKYYGVRPALKLGFEVIST